MRAGISRTLKGHKCSQNQLQALATGRLDIIKPKVHKNCFICARKMILYPSFSSQKCCSKTCYGKYQSIYHRGKNGHAYINGNSKNKYTCDWNEELRIKILRRGSYTCRRCRKKLERSKLNIHHIDGTKTNHKENNLEILCDSCHPIVHSPHLILTS